MKIARHNIKAKLKFYLWLVSNGCDVKNFDPANLQIHEIPPRQKSSFKKRADEIKQKYNHVFNFPPERQRILNIINSELNFVPKN